MFDNPEKLFIILLIALFIFGPQKLIGLGASMGKAVRDFRSHVREAQDQFSAAVAEAQKTEEEFTASAQAALPAPEPIVPAYPTPADPAQATEPATIGEADAAAASAAPAPTPASGAGPSSAGSSSASAVEDEGPHSLASEPSSQAVLETLQRKT